MAAQQYHTTMSHTVTPHEKQSTVSHTLYFHLNVSIRQHMKTLSVDQKEYSRRKVLEDITANQK